MSGGRSAQRLVMAITVLAVVAEVAFVELVPVVRMSAATLAVGVVAQLAATAALSISGSRAHRGLLAGLVVAGALSCAPGPWRTLVVLGAVPWINVALAWAATCLGAGSPSREVLRLSGAAATTYVAAVAALRPGSSSTAVLSTASPLLGGLCVGLILRLRRGRAYRAAALAAQRDMEALRVLVDERQRVADELHDNLGHILTLMVLQANTLAADPDGDVVGSAQTMSHLGRRGIEALRTALQLVADPNQTATTAAAEGGTPAGTLRALIDDATQAGQEVTLHLPDRPLRPGPPVAAAMVRAAREALTNARRHAPGASTAIDVRTETATDTVTLTVTNGPAPDPRPADPGTGRGLHAVSRGVSMLGGTCRHGATDEGGYELKVRIPPTSSDRVAPALRA